MYIWRDKIEVLGLRRAEGRLAEALAEALAVALALVYTNMLLSRFI